mgnify:CR=1 FL=1
MRMGSVNAIADPGKRFVLTEYGYNQTPEDIKRERKIGEPVKGYEESVPVSWIKKGYVEED